MRFNVLLLLLACCWAASTRVATTAAAAATARPTAAAPALQALLRLLKQHESLDGGRSETLVKLGKEVVKALSGENSSQQPPARLAAGTLETLARAVPRVATSGHRAQLLVERGKLLQLMARAEAAETEMEQAAALLTAELQGWQAPSQQGGTPAGETSGETAVEAARAAADSAAGEAAEAEASPSPPGSPKTPRSKAAASAALSTLLDVASTLRQLGREARANELLTGAVAVAPRLGAANSYLRGLAQLSKFTDEQLAGVLSCKAAVEGSGGPAAAGCSWMRLNPDGTQGPAHKPLPDLHRLYYAAHRGLHARRRYAEAWSALDQAKRLHFQPHSGNYTDKDYQGGLAELHRLFPPASEGRATLAQDAAAAGNQGAAAAGDEAVDAAAAAAAGELPAAAQPADAKASAPVQGPAAGSAAWLQRQLRKLTKGSGAATQGEGGEGGSAGAGGGGGSREMRAIFVTGLPRSGSTLIEQILASHPEVFGAGEHTVMRPVATRVQELLEAGNGSVDPSLLAQLRRRYLSGMRAQDACIVHAVRHPADAALSAFQQSFYPHKVPWSFNLSTIASNVAAHHELMAHWDAAFPGRVLHLHYAHMVADQEGSTRRLAQHCGLPWHDVMLRFYETDRSVQTASQLQVKKPIYSSSLDKWHAYKEGLAPLLLQLRETILRYEQQAGLPSSKQLLDELAAQASAAAEQQQAAAQQPTGQRTAEAVDGPAGAGGQAAGAAGQGQDVVPAAQDEGQPGQQVGTEDQETTAEVAGAATETAPFTADNSAAAAQDASQAGSKDEL
ncbi:hypothetical protein ABPG75_013197 [Micractinium tetrahymenae]